MTLKKLKSNFSCVHQVQSCFETFCMSAFSRFLNSVNLYHTIMYNCKKGIIVIMSGFNFIKKKKLNYINTIIELYY